MTNFSFFVEGFSQIGGGGKVPSALKYPGPQQIITSSNHGSGARDLLPSLSQLTSPPSIASSNSSPLNLLYLRHNTESAFPSCALFLSKILSLFAHCASSLDFCNCLNLGFRTLSLYRGGASQAVVD
ncbi:hypothetical protein VN97_g6710 [Penicillium thymicola]|uniref:Uncharacterized protein n=1 Tax=Penicillium thymicola TaxID=293382 RepID=A0AAI9TFW4_PENTH|nr:hypothetical protein VN97_g6710 [Penicillium thymicola]